MANPNEQNDKSRRGFLTDAGKFTAASALATSIIPHVHAAEDNSIQLALVGCGGRGSGAAANALSVKSGQTKLVAMADVFDNRLSSSYNALEGRHADKMDVPAERKFIGFDAYKKAMDCLKPGDIAIFATPPRVSLGALHLRDRKGVERLHGKACHGGWPKYKTDASTSGSGDGEEPQGRRGAHVSP